MPHGHPDYGIAAPTKTVYTMQDLGELAARLGSIVTFDRRGNVIALDDFESGIEKWWVSGVGAGRNIEWSAERGRSGGFSLKLTTGTTTGNNTIANLRLPYPRLSRIGVEFSIALSINVGLLILYCLLFDGTYRHEIRMRLSTSDGLLQYWGPDYAYHDLSPVLDVLSVETVFSTFKLVADFITEKYVRLLANNSYYDLSGFAYRKTSDNTDPHITLGVEIITDEDAYAFSYLDDLIITQNEP